VYVCHRTNKSMHMSWKQIRFLKRCVF
jgi:hypothetical protein